MPFVSLSNNFALLTDCLLIGIAAACPAFGMNSSPLGQSSSGKKTSFLTHALFGLCHGIVWKSTALNKQSWLLKEQC